MTEVSQDDPSLRAGNMQSAPEKVNVARYVERLLANKELDGQEVIDRFIGAVVANGEVEGSVATYTPEDILLIISSVAGVRHEASRQSEGSDEERLQAIEAADKMKFKITNKNGYRSAFDALSGDERTTNLMRLSGSYASLLGRAGLDGGTSGFASLEMLHSYLLVTSENYRLNPKHDDATAAEAKSLDGVMSSVEIYAGGGHGRVGFRERLDQLVAFAPEGDKESALQTKRQLITLERRGANMNLIASTAERLQKYRRFRGLGAMIVEHVRV